MVLARFKFQIPFDSKKDQSWAVEISLVNKIGLN